MEIEHNFGNMHDYWNPIATGKAPLEKNKANELLNGAWQDLSSLKRYILNIPSSVRSLPAHDYHKLLETSDSIIKVITCFESFWFARYLDAQVKEAKLNKKKEAIQQRLASIYPDHLELAVALPKLKELPPHTSAYEALIGKQGIISSRVLQAVLNIYSDILIYRCLENSGLKSAEDLIQLIEKKQSEGCSNLFSILQMHLDESRENARAKMKPDQLMLFDKQWKAPCFIAGCYSDYIQTSSSFPPSKIEATDFLLHYNQKPNPINYGYKKKDSNECLLYFSSLYQLDISNRNLLKHLEQSTRSGFTSILLWSPCGEKFYLLEQKGTNAKNNEISHAVALEEGFFNASLSIHTNPAYAVAQVKPFINSKKADHSLLAYERMSAEEFGARIQKIQTEENIIPFETSFKCDYLLKFENTYFCFSKNAFGDFILDIKENDRIARVSDFDILNDQIIIEHEGKHIKIPNPSTIHASKKTEWEILKPEMAKELGFLSEEHPRERHSMFDQLKQYPEQSVQEALDFILEK